MKALQIVSFGKAAEAVRLVEVEDPSIPTEGEVLLRMEASPINHTDLLMISGRYGYLPQLPSIIGAEAVGTVIATGPNVVELREGDLALIPFLQPAWAEKVKVSASWLRPLPRTDVHQLSMLGINPATAYLLLTENGTLSAGSWIIQNGANSATGRAIISVARALKLKTVNVVRRKEVVPELEALGADVVLVDGPDLSKRVNEAVGGAPVLRGIDVVGGDASLSLMTCLAADSTQIVYGVISGRQFSGSSPHFIFRNVSVRGFWLARWFKTAVPERIAHMYDFLAALIANGQIKAPIAATYPLTEFVDALDQAAKFSGKVLFTPN